MKLLKLNRVCAVAYFGVGPLALYLATKAYCSALFVAVVFSATFGILAILYRQDLTFQDAHLWTHSSTKGVVAFLAMLLCWLPLYTKWNEPFPMFSALYFIVAGAIFGESLYFLDYLQPVKYENDRIEEKALDMEHREVIGMVTPLAQALMVIFVAGLGAFVLNVISGSSKQIVPRAAWGYTLLGTHAAVGDILWIIRPLHARAKGIRVDLKKFRN